MGACLSSENSEFSDYSNRPTAQVVSLNGDLHRYNIPVSVSHVLEAEASSSSSSSMSSSKILLCNSDSLSYDQYIPSLLEDHQLQANQIYFVLPVSKLQQRLASRDMAALAVKASVAIQNASKNGSNRRKKARISPMLIVAQSLTVDSDGSSDSKSFDSKPQVQPGMSRSGSIRKLQRYTSRRAKLAVRSFRLRLSTIYEGSILNGCNHFERRCRRLVEEQRAKFYILRWCITMLVCWHECGYS